MEVDAAGRSIFRSDTVAFKSSLGRVRMLVPVPASSGTGTPSNMVQVQRVDAAVVETANAGDLTIVDRSYLRPGMVVASASDPGGQLGVVTAAATALDLVRIDDGGHQAVASGVSPAELRRVRELSIGDYVVSRSHGCLGRVVEAYLDVDVLFHDGGRCRVTEVEGKLRFGGKDYLNRYTNTWFYQGQRLVLVKPSSVFRASRWLHGYWKPSYVKGTVAMVKMAGVLVYWLVSQHQAPSAYQRNLDDLIFFCSPYICNWNVGDRCFFRNPAAAQDLMTSGDKHESSSPTARGGRKRQRLLRNRRRRETRFLQFERPMSVANTHTTVDVLWQDGTRQRGVPSASLCPFVPTNEHDFFPGQHVRRAWPPGNDDDDDAPVVGVVRSLNCKDQTVRVSWLTRNNEVHYDETISAYHLGTILDHNVFYGDIVVRLHDGDAAGRSDLSWVGRVLDLCDGRVQVKWGDGTTTEVLPHDIAVVQEQSVSEMLRQMGDWVYDDGSDDAQGETDQAEPTADTGNNDEGENNTDDDPAATSVIASICSVIIRLGSKVLEQGKRFWLSGWTTVQASSAGLAAASENIEPVSSGVGESERKAEAGVEAFRFQQFDVVQSPLDHWYLDNVGQDTSGGRYWTKRVQREWKILANDLPDTIYVRAFEDRMDLLRAVMVGASGTPYQDGLFFFDLQLPPSYPAAPPLVNYWSFGLRVNPNLYQSGTVCLSLLGTFGGQDIELWSPASTVLQVLVSIQGLVLTAQPYYNEAGYAPQVGTPTGYRNELPYSENTYLLSLQTMLHLLHRPPAGFEEFVTDHFRRRGRHVLRACEAYQEGCLVGTLDGEANATVASSAHPCSTGFRLALANIVPRLMVAFAEIGCEGGGHVLSE